MSSKSLYVLITGFGSPHYDEKVTIFQKNLEKIIEYPWKTVKFVVCQYNDIETHQFPTDLIKARGIDIDVIYEKGIVGQFMKKWADPKIINQYDYILTLLDDVELINPDWDKLLQYTEEFEFDLLSPCLTLDSKFQYQYMRHEPNQPNSLKVSPCCEYFCLFANTQRFQKYWNALEDNNPWMWGLDLILRKHLGIRVAIINWMQMKHWYKNECYVNRPDKDPVEGFKFIIDKYKETSDNLARQTPIMYYIIDPFVNKK